MRAIDWRGCVTFYYLINTWLQPDGPVAGAATSATHGFATQKAGGIQRLRLQLCSVLQREIRV
jgi:hypothetical protein